MKIERHALFTSHSHFDSEVVYVDAWFTVKQCIRGNNFILLFEMIGVTQFFVPICPALLHISFVTS